MCIVKRASVIAGLRHRIEPSGRSGTRLPCSSTVSAPPCLVGVRETAAPGSSRSCTRYMPCDVFLRPGRAGGRLLAGPLHASLSSPQVGELWARSRSGPLLPGAETLDRPPRGQESNQKSLNPKFESGMPVLVGTTPDTFDEAASMTPGKYGIMYPPSS